MNDGERPVGMILFWDICGFVVVFPLSSWCLRHQWYATETLSVRRHCKGKWSPRAMMR